MNFRNKKRKDVIDFIYNVQPFDVDILVVIDNDVPSAITYVNENYNQSPIYISEEDVVADGMVTTAISKSGLPNWCVTFKKKRISYSVIAHECLHVVLQIGLSKGMVVSQDSEEFFTYALQHFMDKIIKVLKENKIKIKDVQD